MVCWHLLVLSVVSFLRVNGELCQTSAISASGTSWTLSLLGIWSSKRDNASQVCRRCNQEKPAAEFYKNRLMLDGLYSHCKACYQAAASVSSAAEPTSISPTSGGVSFAAVPMLTNAVLVGCP
jgi:hypothetical protein